MGRPREELVRWARRVFGKHSAQQLHQDGGEDTETSPINPVCVYADWHVMALSPSQQTNTAVYGLL